MACTDIKTINIEDGNGAFITINECDYDPEKNRLFGVITLHIPAENDKDGTPELPAEAVSVGEKTIIKKRVDTIK
jgi:hypothetical protein